MIVALFSTLKFVCMYGLICLLSNVSNSGCHRFNCDMSRGMRFPTMCHFDMCRLGRVSAASC